MNQLTNLTATDLSAQHEQDAKDLTRILPASRKVYIQGSRPDLRVPMREIALTDTPTEQGLEKNPALMVYDTSGVYTDPNINIDLNSGLPHIRETWIAERNDTECLDTLSSKFGQERRTHSKATPCQNWEQRDANALCQARYYYPRNGIYRDP